MGSYVNYAPIIAYGTLYPGSFDGYIHAFNITTGKQLWEFSSGTTQETVFNRWPFWNGPIIADRVIFAGTGEETPTQPLTRGNKVFAIDATTGEEIWNITGYMSLRAIADGYLVGYNGYDNQIYVFGKGPSATTVSVSAKTVTKGSQILIEGTVTDRSPGQKGTPCVAKESMAVWMEYLHMQKTCPTEVKGVPVELYAVYPDGSYKYIDTTTTNGFYGAFSYAWIPPDEGVYTIIATFKGDESYGSSSAATSLLVVAAPPEGLAPVEAPAYRQIDLVIIVAVAVAIVIGVINLVIMVKKMRK